MKVKLYNSEVDKAVQSLEEDISESNEQIKLIKNIDWNKKVTEEEWHKICDTPLRTSELLAVLVKNIFPDAENISVSVNYVFFDMYGFSCGIPTSRCNGVNININWYKKDQGEPKQAYTLKQSKMKAYFKAMDNHDPWYVYARFIVPNGELCRKWVLFFKWFFYYTWKDDHREDWEEDFRFSEAQLENEKQKYFKERQEMYKKTKKMFEVLIPELKKFSNEVYRLGNSWYTLKNLKDWEGIKF